MAAKRRTDPDALLDRAIGRKWHRYIGSGLLITGVGLLLIVIGFALRMNSYSAEVLLIGFGAIVILIGILRILIGFINPLAPSDLNTVVDNEHTPSLDKQLIAPSDD